MDKKYQDALVLLSELLSKKDREKEIEALEREIKELENYRIMIVDSMTHEEVYQELERERDAVTTWWRHQLNDQRRRALKCTRFPMHIWKEYTSTRKNRYVFFSRVFNKRMKTILTGVAVPRMMKDGMYVYTSWLADHKLIFPMVLTPHMWKRYQDPDRGVPSVYRKLQADHPQSCRVWNPVHYL